MKDKGVSPLLAVAFLIGLTMAAAVIIIVWTKGQIGSELREADLSIARAESCGQVRIKADNAAYDDVGRTVTAVLRNVGDASITDFRLIVYYESDPIFPNIFTPSNFDAKMQSGELLVLKATDVTQRPSKLFIEGLWKKGQCPDIQPLYECRYIGTTFVC